MFQSFRLLEPAAVAASWTQVSLQRIRSIFLIQNSKVARALLGTER